MPADAFPDPSSACPESGPSAASRMLSFFVFNTNVTLTVYGNDCPSLDEGLLSCRDRCVRFERLLSRTRADSDLSRINRGAPASVRVAFETADVVKSALGYCERSGGLFDITMGTATSLWDFHRGVVPSKWALARAVEHVDWHCVHVGADAAGLPTVALDDPASVLDVGGFAKGYVADDLAGLLRARGISRFSLNLGGNVMLSCGDGGSGACEPWRVGIVDPFAPKTFRAVVEVENGSVATSGAHERRFCRGGATFHHILDPRDGMPARTDVASASVVASRSVDCDGYSTTLFMMGVEAALEFAERTAGIEAVIIDERGGLHWTSGLENRVSPVG